MPAILQFILLALGIMSGTYAQDIKIFNEGTLHEATLTRPFNPIPLQAIEKTPPELISEDIPFQTDAKSIWINGYWDWNPLMKRFVWMTGIWRKPPPEHKWIPGFWKRYDTGWVRFSGFWSLNTDFSYISLTPPDPITEYPQNRPATANFWMSGYWHYFAESEEYGWVPGAWLTMDPDWVLIPPHYIWRPEGFIFIPAYWDWPLDKIGRIYSPVLIDPEKFQTALQPVVYRDGEEILEQGFLRYPDYLPYLQHHYEYNPDHWILFRDTPPWWKWPLWWNLTWNNQWALWWWYTHGGYPQPHWMTEALANAIPPPYRAFTNRFRNVAPPLTATPQGVVSTERLLSAMAEVESKGRVINGKILPIISADTSIAQDIRVTAQPSLPINGILLPTGFGSKIRKLTQDEIELPFKILSQADKERAKGKEVHSSEFKINLPKKPSLDFLHPIKTYQKDEKPIFESQSNKRN